MSGQVCTRNDALEDVISRTPSSKREDLVFLQNGVLGPLLDKHGLAKNTQVIPTSKAPDVVRTRVTSVIRVVCSSVLSGSND